MLALLVEQLERVHVLDGALLAREARDVAGGLAVEGLGVDERARAVVRAEVAARLLVVDRRVLDVDRLIETDERRLAAAARHAECLERGADRAGLTAVRVEVDLGVRDALLDVIDLRLERGEVLLRAALEDEHAAELGHARDLDDVLPDVLRQHEREAGEQLLLRVAFLLEVHAVGVEEHGAAVAELRREARFERDLGVLLHGHAELIGHRLQQHAVTGASSCSTGGSSSRRRSA